MSQGAEFDAVVIGRNEGERLPTALRTVMGRARRVIYVDSGSRDDSVAQARTLGVQVLELDPVRPFSAARARNEGFAALAAERAALVQFLDCDCILSPDWFDAAISHLDAHPRAGLVHGHYSEEAPERSSYNWMTDWEWKVPPGPKASGIGTFMARSEAFAASRGFRDDMIAAEDDELFLRLRAAGWETWCIPVPMCTHDVRLLTFSNWYRRMVRAGHSFAELGVLHPGAARASRRRAYFWAGALPVLALLTAIFAPPLLAAIAALYAASILRQTRRFMAMGLQPKSAFQVAALLMISKFANLQGIATYWVRKLRRSRARIIEYR